MTYFDFAAALQARTCTDLEAEKIAHMSRARRDGTNEVKMTCWSCAPLHWRKRLLMPRSSQSSDARRRRQGPRRLQSWKPISLRFSKRLQRPKHFEQQRQEAETAKKRADHLVAELVDLTEEFAGMSKRVAEQTAAMDRLRAELDRLQFKV